MKNLAKIGWVLIAVTFFTCSRDVPGERGFDKEELAELNTISRYDYDRLIEPSGNPILEFLSNVISFLAGLFNSVFGYVIIIALILVIVYLIITNVQLSKDDDAAEEKSTIRSFHDLDPAEADYLPLLRKALKSKDFRTAIRYTFLDTLKSLQKTQDIVWHREKTNYDYLGELGTSQQGDFRKLISVYEYVWYGEFPATEQLYAEATGLSDQLKKGKGVQD